MKSHCFAAGLRFAAWHFIPMALCMTPLLAAGQAIPGEVEKALLQRQQQHDEFSLRLRQSQEQLIPALTPRQRLDLDQRHREQRQHQEALHDAQLRRHMELQQTLPQQPEHQQTSELQRESARFARERAGQPAQAQP